MCTFVNARMSLSNSIRIPCACSIGSLCAISGKSSPKPFVTRQFIKYQTLMLVSVLYMTAANALASLYICIGSSEPSSQYPNLMCWLK